MKSTILLFLIIIGSIGPVFCQQLDLNAHVKLTPVSSGAFSLNGWKANKASAVIFFSPECPICKGFTKSLRELADSFSGQGIKFYLIFPGDFSVAQIRKFQKQYTLAIPAYKDENKQLVKILGATTTPQAFVISPEGGIIYSGKIDNWYENIGKQRTVITQFYLRDALIAVLNHNQPYIKKTEPVGCFININR